MYPVVWTLLGLILGGPPAAPPQPAPAAEIAPPPRAVLPEPEDRLPNPGDSLIILPPEFAFDGYGHKPALDKWVLGERIFFRYRILGACADDPSSLTVAITVDILDGLKHRRVCRLGTCVKHGAATPQPGVAMVTGYGILNNGRQGPFILRLQVKDTATGKTVSYEAPYLVLDP